MSVRRCQAEVDSAEFGEWIAHDRRNPIGQDWLQTGIICSTVANMITAAVGGKKGRRKLWKPTDFMPVTEVKERQTPAEMEAVFRRATALATGRR